MNYCLGLFRAQQMIKPILFIFYGKAGSAVPFAGLDYFNTGESGVTVAGKKFGGGCSIHKELLVSAHSQTRKSPFRKGGG